MCVSKSFEPCPNLGMAVSEGSEEVAERECPVIKAETGDLALNKVMQRKKYRRMAQDKIIMQIGFDCLVFRRIRRLHIC